MYLTRYIWLIEHNQRSFIAPAFFLGSQTVFSFNLFLFVLFVL